MEDEKAVFTFDKVNDTIITVVEALGGKQVTQEKEKHPLVGMWVQCIHGKDKSFTKGKWYQCEGYIYEARAFTNDLGEKDGFHPKNDEYFNLTDPRPYNPDRVRELVGKKVKHIPTGEYHEFVEGLFRPYEDYDLSDYKDIEEILYVPDNIKFYDWHGDLTLEVSDGVCLSGSPTKSFILTDFPIKSKETYFPIKCKLVPVKYDEIEVGDFVTVYGLQDKITSYSMKHGDHKFCGMEDDGFKFNEDWYDDETGNLLKVVKA